MSYEHLRVTLVDNERENAYFNLTVKCVTKHNVELSDEDFKRIYNLCVRGKDVDWILSVMKAHNSPLVDVLIAYMTY